MAARVPWQHPLQLQDYEERFKKITIKGVAGSNAKLQQPRTTGLSCSQVQRGRIKCFFQQRSEEADKLTLNISQLFHNSEMGHLAWACGSHIGKEQQVPKDMDSQSYWFHDQWEVSHYCRPWKPYTHLTPACHLETPSFEFSVTSQFCERLSMLQIDALGNMVRIALPGQEDMKAFMEACHWWHCPWPKTFIMRRF